MEINGYRAVVNYDPDINMFRGEFVGLNGGADFYAKDIDNLRREDRVEPRKAYSGEFNLRVSPHLHAEIAARAVAEGKSLNQWVADVLDESLHAH